MGAHGSKEKLTRSASERYVHVQSIERERFGSFGKRGRTGPAKKRDVRTINSSSSDLGPPSKTVGSNGNGTATVTVTTSNNNTNNQHQQQTQHQRASLRAAATLQKRISSTPGSGLANTTIPSIVPEQLKGSPPPPKRNFIAKRTLSTPVQGSTVVKTPLKGKHRAWPPRI
ncbi:uncharacterized protein LOC109417649 isoform X3 [Aedes albopictus]|uniref:Uncharacterized protein n=1 Tax=Aedes albopictus TaxID=7160 RepID=A0ABM1YA20_AEDAL